MRAPRIFCATDYTRKSAAGLLAGSEDTSRYSNLLVGVELVGMAAPCPFENNQMGTRNQMAVEVPILSKFAFDRWAFFQMEIKWNSDPCAAWLSVNLPGERSSQAAYLLRTSFVRVSLLQVISWANASAPGP